MNRLTEQERLRQVFLKWAAERDGIDMSGYSEVEIEFGCFIAGYELASARAEAAEAEAAKWREDAEALRKLAAKQEEVL
jgi:hypothetical protein